MTEVTSSEVGTTTRNHKTASLRILVRKTVLRAAQGPRVKLSQLKNLRSRKKTLRKEEVNHHYPTSRSLAVGRARRSIDAKFLLRVLNPARTVRGMRGKAAPRIGFTRAGGHLQTGKLIIGGLSLGIGDITKSIILGERVTQSNKMTMIGTIIASVTLKIC